MYCILYFHMHKNSFFFFFYLPQLLVNDTYFWAYASNFLSSSSFLIHLLLSLASYSSSSTTSVSSSISCCRCCCFCFSSSSSRYLWVSPAAKWSEVCGVERQSAGGPKGLRHPDCFRRRKLAKGQALRGSAGLRQDAPPSLAFSSFLFIDVLFFLLLLNNQLRWCISFMNNVNIYFQIKCKRGTLWK